MANGIINKYFIRCICSFGYFTCKLKLFNENFIIQAGEKYLESGAGSTMLKFGLLLVLANLFLKMFIGIGLWKIAMEFKKGLKSSQNYEEEQI